MTGWLQPLTPTQFSALPMKKTGRPLVRIKYKGVRYKSISECAQAHGYSVSHMRKILSRRKRARD
jgi:hypothetical protein